MLQEALQSLVDLARQSTEAKVVDAEHEPEGVYYVRKPGGSMELVHAEAPLRLHTALDLTAVADFARGHAETAEVWYSRQAAVCVISRDERRERVTLALEFSPQLQELKKLEACHRAMDQRSIIFLLRTTFRRCLGRAGNLLDVLRAVRFSSAADGEGVVQHGKASVGKSLKQEISGAAAIPEYVALSVPVFTHPTLGAQFAVELALEPDAATQTFKLIPLPNEIEQAVASGEAMVRDTLAELLGDAGVPVYYGRP